MIPQKELYNKVNIPMVGFGSCLAYAGSEMDQRGRIQEQQGPDKGAAAADSQESHHFRRIALQGTDCGMGCGERMSG